MADADFSLKITGPGYSVDEKITKDLATRIMMLVLSDGRADVSQGDSENAGWKKDAIPARKVDVGKLALREYFDQHKVKTIPQQILAIGAFRESKSGKTFFTRAELDSGFGEAKEPEPGNPTRDLAKTIKLGWIAPQGEKDKFYVTGTGEDALNANFEGAKGKSRRGRRGRRNRKTSSKASK